MLRIKCYDKDSFSFYKEIVKSKRNTKNKPHLKQELAALEDKQSFCFKEYDEAFCSDALSNIESQEFSLIDKNNLQALYSFRLKKIQELKNLLTRHPINPDHILNVCQNCTINEVDSMDHVLGQAEFPEFSVHPKNLFPCCSVCNKKKSDRNFDVEESQMFLNLFLDDLPESQYLYVEFGNNWLPSFRLEQPQCVENEVFHIIQRHYQNLDLLNRFSKNSNELINDLRSTIKVFGTDNINIGEKVDEICHDLAPYLGYNHRKIIIWKELGRSEAFINESLQS